MPPCIIRYWLTGYIRHLWGSAWARNPRKEMPADPIEGLQWIVPKLLKDLTEAKMWPIKMMQVKHQETLCDSHAPNCGIIHLYIYIPFSYYFKIHYLCITKGHICFSGLWGAAGSEVTRCLRSPRVWRPPFSRWNTIWTSTKRTAWLSWVGLWVFIPFNVIAIIFAAEIFHVSITGKPSMGRP